MPVMPPVSGNQAMVPMGGIQSMGGTIPLSTLIEFIIQRTYHDLTVLSELLQGKADMDRKVEIIQFASRTRQLFVRLLALVKWTNSATKVDKCARILSFLQHQQMLFVDTADRLACMARETLVHARLPCFSLPCAVDVLTTGTYPRLPACIKDKIVPPGPINAMEKRQTLERLSQIIEHRIVTIDLPRHMCKPVVSNGRVKFRVEHEFEVTLTLMGDGPSIPWRLLDIEILVEDPETGDGQALVHSLQVMYIHQLVQSRLIDSEQPLDDLYTCLHTFCQSLQLEVLQSQAQNLILRRVGDCVHIEEYVVGSRLLLSYWRDTNKKDSKPFQQAYKLSVHTDDTDKNRPLRISHFPQIMGSEGSKVAQAITSDYLSIEKLLVHTIQVRSLAKLKDLERELRVILSTTCDIKDVPIVLYVPLLYPCLDSEKLCITVDLMKGMFLVSIAQKDTNLTHEIQECLNSDKRDLRKLLYNLKCWLMLERCRKSLQHQLVPYYDQLPFNNLPGHALESLSRHRLYAKLPKQPDYYLVIEIHDVAPEKKRKVVEYRFHLLKVRQERAAAGIGNMAGAADSSDASTSAVTLETFDPSRLFLRAGHLAQLDTFLCTHGQSGKVYDVEPEDPDYLSRKRKLLLGDTKDLCESLSTAKKARSSVWFVPELMHIIALCEERLPLVALGEELEKRGIPHQGVQIDGEGVGMSLSLVHAPPCPSDIEASVVKQLNNCVLSVTFRLQHRGIRIWLAEAVFAKSPVRSTSVHEQGCFQRVLLLLDKLNTDSAEKIVDAFIVNEWTSISHLYVAILQFAQIYNENAELRNDVEVKSYNFKQLILAYGPSKCYMATVTYTGGQFRIVFGTTGHANVPNCHTMVATYLEKDLNQTGSIALLARTLAKSWSLLVSVSKLPTCPVPYFRKQQIVPTFSVIPQSSTHVRVIYRSTYCLDFQCRDTHLVSVRDGAYSMFESSKVVEGLSPIQNLQSFLNMYVDETVLRSQARRRSTTEDDNPPSPIGLDPMDGLMSQPSNPVGIGGPSRRDMIAPSPSSVLIPSPGNLGLHAPSPPPFNVAAPSPGTLGIHMTSPAPGVFISPQGMIDGSPYPNPNLIMPSPGSRNWPASPLPGPSSSSSKDSDQRNLMSSMPSRMLPQPQRAWAASVPTLLSQEAIAKVLTPSSGGIAGPPCCPLERFLASVYLRRHLQRIMQATDNMANVLVSEPGVVMFKMDSGLQFRVSFVPSMMLSLRLKVLPSTVDYAGNSSWDSEELQIIERFFETKVACYPYKPNALMSFIQLLKAPPRIFKDFVQLMKLELMPDRNMRWSLQWCLIVPLNLSDSLIGQSAVVIQPAKMVFMLQLTRNMQQQQQQQQQAGAQPSPMEPQTFVVPILYNVQMNKTQMMLDQKPSLSQAVIAVSTMLNRFYELNRMSDSISIFPAIREVLTNLLF